MITDITMSCNGVQIINALELMDRQYYLMIVFIHFIQLACYQSDKTTSYKAPHSWYEVHKQRHLTALGSMVYEIHNMFC